MSIVNPPQVTGSALVKLTPTGAVNGVNVTFTFTAIPTVIFADNTWLFSTDNNGGVNWTLSGLTVTMTTPPQNALYAI